MRFGDVSSIEVGQRISVGSVFNLQLGCPRVFVRWAPIAGRSADVLGAYVRRTERHITVDLDQRGRVFAGQVEGTVWGLVGPARRPIVLVRWRSSSWSRS